MSTCSTKCAPPLRSSPKAIGSPPMLLSHSGVVEARLRATTNWRSSPGGFRWSRSNALPRNCSSASPTRSRPPSGIRSLATTGTPPSLQDVREFLEQAVVEVERRVVHRDLQGEVGRKTG